MSFLPRPGFGGAPLGHISKYLAILENGARMVIAAIASCGRSGTCGLKIEVEREPIGGLSCCPGLGAGSVYFENLPCVESL